MLNITDQIRVNDSVTQIYLHTIRHELPVYVVMQNKISKSRI